MTFRWTCMTMCWHYDDSLIASWPWILLDYPTLILTIIFISLYPILILIITSWSWLLLNYAYQSGLSHHHPDYYWITSLTKAHIISLTTTGLPYLNTNYHILTLNSIGLLYCNLDYHSLTLTAILWPWLQIDYVSLTFTLILWHWILVDYVSLTFNIISWS